MVSRMAEDGDMRSSTGTSRIHRPALGDRPTVRDGFFPMDLLRSLPMRRLAGLGKLTCCPEALYGHRDA